MKTTARLTTVLMGLVATEAAAVVPIDRALAPTPERLIATFTDHDRAVDSAVITEAGLRTVSWRADGTPAIAWSMGADIDVSSNLHPLAAAERALGLAQSLAPDLGVHAADFSVGGLTSLEGWTTVLIAQARDGVPVRDGHLVVTFRHGHVTMLKNELVIGLDLDVRAKPIDPGAATRVALKAADRVGPSTLVAPASLEVWAPSDDPSVARLAYAVGTRSETPRSALTVHVDARTGEVLAADDDVRWADGRVTMRTERNTIGDPKVPISIPHAGLGGGTTDEDGEVRISGAGTLTYSSDWVRISDRSGDPLERIPVSFSGAFDVVELDSRDATQAHPFLHLNLVKAYAARITPNLRWVTERLTSNVNINDTCNAFWDGQTVNFFRTGGGCNNTGRIASIVYHEFGHGYHQALTRRVVGSIGEGTGDYLSATILEDSVVGRGFRSDGSGIRRLDRNKRYPNDYVGEVHQDGLIWATALWRLRAALQAKHGDVDGRRITDRIFARALTEGPGLTTAYPAIIAADDDDSNLSNGTPNSCEINAIFDEHGLLVGGQINHQPAATRPFAVIEHDAPGVVELDKGRVQLRVTAGNASSCGTVDPQAIELHYSINGGAFSTEAVASSVATIEGLSNGDLIEYYFTIEAGGVTFNSGSERNAHRARVGAFGYILFGEDFESGLSAWTHGVANSDAHDDWEAGQPTGRAYDPERAHGASAVAGTDLGLGLAVGSSDGAAKAGRTSYLETPAFSTRDRVGVRLDFWEHFALTGTRRVLVDGREVWSEQTSNATSGGWRFRSIPLGAEVADRDDVVVRFEVTTGSGNMLGGWSLDDIEVGGQVPPTDVLDLPGPGLGTITPIARAPDGTVTTPLPAQGVAPSGPVSLFGGVAGGCRCVREEPSAPGWCVVLIGLALLGRRTRAFVL